MEYKKIIFDCDSTLVKIEGLDELARVKGKKEIVGELTKLSMDGKVRLEDVFALKMAMIKPTRDDMKLLGKLYIENLVDDVKDVITLLNRLGKDVLQITGNFYPAIKILCDYLGINENNIYSNTIFFNERGDYLGFDSKGLLSISGGKRSITEQIAIGNPSEKIVFIGDGSTDMETKPPAELFIGFGGIMQRDNVKQNSDIYIKSQSMAPILRFILSKEEQYKGESISPGLFAKADLLIRSGKVEVKTKKVL